MKYELKKKSKLPEVEKYLVGELSEYLCYALREVHAGAARVLERLNIECLQLVRMLKQTEFFSHDSVNQIPDPNVAAHFLQIFSGATGRLLDLGVIFTHHDSKQGTYAYHWTYVGRLVRDTV